jgi:hypothetical protein
MIAAREVGFKLPEKSGFRKMGLGSEQLPIPISRVPAMRLRERN